jgi:hypothetical protein
VEKELHKYLMEAWIQLLMEIKINDIRKHKTPRRGIRIYEVLMKWLILLMNRWKRLETSWSGCL